MAQTDTRNVEQIRRDADRARADLTDAVQLLRESVSDAASDVRQRLSPEGIRDDLVDAARRNPFQAAAVGALAAWPAIRLVRAIPLPVLMIGAGLFLTSSKSGQDLSRKAIGGASDLADETRRRAQELAAVAMETASDLSDRASQTTEDARRRALDAADKATAAVSDAAARASSAASDILSSKGAGPGVDDIAETARDAMGAVGEKVRSVQRDAMSSGEDLLAWAKAHPMIVAGLGLAAGAFVANALPPTDTERGVAGTVSGAMRDAARQGVNAAVGAAAVAAVDLARRAAEQGLDRDRFAQEAREYDGPMKTAKATADAAFGQPGDRGRQHAKSGD
ncbi:MAG: hypothetical protein KDJ20_15095 [Hyphomicrobiales bacterium]|nr:hypothetical protein [Hyphomicrobiales bacterium]MCC2108054.1 hypothetical protein [Hyphomicrobiales bacterium]HPG03431.1 hypothetical protein [Rhodoblastus sp.]HRY03705.1 hypothetical protein [Beijerinckiaceae bacterium]